MERRDNRMQKEKIMLPKGGDITEKRQVQKDVSASAKQAGKE